MQKDARDHYRIVDLPGYMEWSKHKLAEGELPDIIANLSGSSSFLLPEDAAKMTVADYEALLASLKKYRERTS